MNVEEFPEREKEGWQRRMGLLSCSKATAHSVTAEVWDKDSGNANGQLALK